MTSKVIFAYTGRKYLANVNQAATPYSHDLAHCKTRKLFHKQQKIKRA